MLTTLDHVMVNVRDLDAATADYAAMFGRRPSWRGEHPGLGTANALFRLENTYLELISAAGSGPFADQLRSDPEGVKALAFGTDDADACAKALREAGVAAADPVDGRGRDLVSGAERTWRNVMLPESDTRGVFMFAIEHTSPADALPRAEVEGSEAAAISSLDHVVVRTADGDAAAAFYGEKLGIRLALDRTFAERGVRLMFFRIGDVTVEVATAAGGGSADAANTSDSLWGLAWQVPDADAARTRIAAAGIDVSEVRKGNKPGTRVCTVKERTGGVPTLLVGPE